MRIRVWLGVFIIFVITLLNDGQQRRQPVCLSTTMGKHRNDGGEQMAKATGNDRRTSPVVGMASEGKEKGEGGR